MTWAGYVERMKDGQTGKDAQKVEGKRRREDRDSDGRMALRGVWKIKGKLRTRARENKLDFYKKKSKEKRRKKSTTKTETMASRIPDDRDVYMPVIGPQFPILLFLFGIGEAWHIGPPLVTPLVRYGQLPRIRHSATDRMTNTMCGW